MNTLQGVLGFIGNDQGLGIRVTKDHVGAARALLQSSNSRLSASNRHVIGGKRFMIKGLPLNIGAQQLTELLLAKPSQQDAWAPWSVIPIKMLPSIATCAWIVKADSDPATFRIILPGGMKIVIEKADTPFDAAKKKQEELQLKNESAKSQRRERLLKAQSSDSTANDPWQKYLDGKGKGRGNEKKQAAHAGPPQDGSKQEIAEIRQQVSALTNRMDAQDRRLDNLEGTLKSHLVPQRVSLCRDRFFKAVSLLSYTVVGNHTQSLCLMTHLFLFKRQFPCR